MDRRLLLRGAALACALLSGLWAPAARAVPFTWSKGVAITENAQDDVGAHAVADAGGNVHVVWERGGSVYHRVRTSSGLGPEELVGVGGAPAVAIGPDGVPFVALVSAGQALVTSRAGGAWATPEVAIAGGVANVDLAVAGDGTVHVAAGGDFDGGRPDVTYYRSVGGAYSAVSTWYGWFDAWPCYCGEYFYTPDVEVDAAGNYYLAFRHGGPGSGSGLWSGLHVVTDNPTWATKEFVGPNYGINSHVFRKGSLGVDAAGVLHGVQWGSGRCYATTVDGNGVTDVDLGAGSQPALAVDGAGAVHVAYQDASGQVVYVRAEDAAFSTWTVSPAGGWPTVAADGSVFFEEGADLELRHVLAGSAPSASPSSHDFGAVPVDGAATADVSIENGAGAKPVLLGAVALSGPDAARFAIASDGCSGALLPAGGACAMVVRFSPDAVGSFSAALEVPSSSPHALGPVTLSGSAITCAYALSAASAAIGTDPWEGTVDVTASDPACPWAATANDGFLEVLAPGGTGSGFVAWTAAPNSGPAREGTLTIAGETFTVAQADGCRIGLHAPGTPATSSDVEAAGGEVAVVVSASDAACAWSASADASWISLSSGASGAGDAELLLEVAPNAGPPRSGTVSVNGETFTVEQGDGCAFTVAPETASVSAGVEGGTISVTASDPACAWTAAVEDAWISVASGASGEGDGVVSFDTDANLGPARSGALTVAGATVLVEQADGCTFSISPGSAAAAHGGASGTVAVTASDAACAWTAEAVDGWLTVDSGASGVGGGAVAWTAAANGGAARSGTLAVAGETFAVDQAAHPAEPPVNPPGDPADTGGGGCSTAPFGPEALVLAFLALFRTRRRA